MHDRIDCGSGSSLNGSGGDLWKVSSLPGGATKATLVAGPSKEQADAAREQFIGVVVYLFGAISQDPLYKRRFKEAQAYCEQWGMTVLNPTRHPIDRSGRLSYDYYMQHSLLDILACEVMVPVPSPYLEASKGASAERAYGQCLGRKILDGFIPWEG